MHRPQVVLHVRVDVRVRRAERGVAVGHSGGGEADQRDVGDDGAPGQTCRTEKGRGF